MLTWQSAASFIILYLVILIRSESAMSTSWNHTSCGQSALPHGFSVYQPTVGSPLQFIPAMGTQQLDEMLHAYLPGHAPIADKRAAVSLDFLEQLHLTGQNYRFYQVESFYSVLAGPRTPSSSTSSPLLDSGASSQCSFPATPSWDFTFVASAPTSKNPRSRKSAHKKGSIKAAGRRGTSRGLPTDFSTLPGMQIMTRDGVDITNCASRGSKTKEQRDHAHLMRIIKACDSCRAKKVRCDPSHKKRPSASTSMSESISPTQALSIIGSDKCPTFGDFESYSSSTASLLFPSSVPVPSKDDSTPILTNESDIKATMSPTAWPYSDSTITLLGRAMASSSHNPNRDHDDASKTAKHFSLATPLLVSTRSSMSDLSRSSPLVHDSPLSGSWGDNSIPIPDGTITPALLESRTTYAEHRADPSPDGIAKIRNETSDVGLDGIAEAIGSARGATAAAQQSDFAFEELVSSGEGFDRASNAGSHLNMLAVNHGLLVFESGLYSTVAEDPGKIEADMVRNLLTGCDQATTLFVTTGHPRPSTCNDLILDIPSRLMVQQPVPNLVAKALATDLRSISPGQSSSAFSHEQRSVASDSLHITTTSLGRHVIAGPDPCQLDASASTNDCAEMLRTVSDCRQGWASNILSRQSEIVAGYLASLCKLILPHWLALILACFHAMVDALRLRAASPAICARSFVSHLVPATYHRATWRL